VLKKKIIWALGKIKDIQALPVLINLLGDNNHTLRHPITVALGKITGDKDVAEFFVTSIYNPGMRLPWETITDNGVEFLITACKDKNPHIRRCAVVALGNTYRKQEDIVECLVKMLDDDSWRVRRDTVIALGKICDKTTIPYIIDVLKNDDIWVVRGNAARVLGNMGVQSVIDDLIFALEDEDSFTRECSAEALGKLKAKNAILPLINLLDDNDECVQIAAISALIAIGKPTVPHIISNLNHIINKKNAFIVFGKLREHQVVDILIKELYNRDEEIVSKAAWALGEIGSISAVAPLINILKKNKESNTCIMHIVEALGKLKAEEAISELVPLLYHNNDIASITISTLSNIGTRCVSHMIDILDNVDNEVAKLHAIIVLGNIKDSRAITSLIPMLKYENKYIRAAAAMALGQIGDKKAIESLIDTALYDNNEDVRVYASYAIGQIKDEGRGLKFLLSALNDNNKDIQFNAAFALGERGYKQGIELLINYLNTYDRRIRKIAIKRIVKIGKPAIYPLINALGSNDSVIRKVATVVLTKIGKDAVYPLIDALNHKHELIRWYSAVALGMLYENIKDDKIKEDIFEGLLDAFNNDSWYARGGAVVAIGNICNDSYDDNKAIVDTLIDLLLYDDNSVVRTAIIEALGKIGNEEVIKILTVVANNDVQPNVRKTAETVLARIQYRIEE
jgi:HEAT repeat protein